MELLQVNTKFSPRELEKMDSAIESGEAINRSDFVRSAVREKLKSIGEA